MPYILWNGKGRFPVKLQKEITSKYNFETHMLGPSKYRNKIEMEDCKANQFKL